MEGEEKLRNLSIASDMKIYPRNYNDDNNEMGWAGMAIGSHIYILGMYSAWKETKV